MTEDKYMQKKEMLIENQNTGSGRWDRVYTECGPPPCYCNS